MFQKNKIKKAFIIALLFFICSGKIFGQHFLPEIHAKNINNRIVISWTNQYKKNVADILIQRSFDSTKNFTTIGSVINPQSIENGFPDDIPPYNKMFYRVTILFEGGSYEIGPSTKPIKEPVIPKDINVTFIPEEVIDSSFVDQDIEIQSPIIPKIMIDSSLKILNIAAINPLANVHFQKPKEKIDSIKKIPLKIEPKKENIKVQINKKEEVKVKTPPSIINVKNNNNVKIEKTVAIILPKADSIKIIPEKKKIESAYPSNSVFVNKTSTLTISIKDSAFLHYQIKFYDDKNKQLFELTKIKSKCFFIDKLNFPHAGWFYFEIYKNGELIEQSKFNIPRDRPKN